MVSVSDPCASGNGGTKEEQVVLSLLADRRGRLQSDLQAKDKRNWITALTMFARGWRGSALLRLLTRDALQSGRRWAAASPSLRSQRLRCAYTSAARQRSDTYYSS